MRFSGRRSMDRKNNKTRVCVEHTNKLVIGVNSGILSQQTPPDNSVSIMPTRYSSASKMVSVRGRAAKATDGRFLDVGPISIPTWTAWRNSWSWSSAKWRVVWEGGWISGKNRNRRLRSGAVSSSVKLRVKRLGHTGRVTTVPGYEATDFRHTPYTGWCRRCWEC